MFALAAKGQTDTSYNCDFCKQKQEEYYSLKHKLKHKWDSLENSVYYHNKYIKDGYFYHFIASNFVYFSWKGCQTVDRGCFSRIRVNNDDWYDDSYVIDDPYIVDCVFTIKKEQLFNMRLDGLSDQYIFYREDLH